MREHWIIKEKEWYMMEVYIEEAVEYRFEGPANTEQFGYLILQLVNMKSNDSSIIEVRTFYDTNDIKVVQVQDNKTYSPVNTVQANGGTLLSEAKWVLLISMTWWDELKEKTFGIFTLQDNWKYFVQIKGKACVIINGVLE